MSNYMHQIQGVVSNVKSKSIVKLYPNNKRDVQITHEVSKVMRRLAHVLMMNICWQMWMRMNGLGQKDEDMKGKGKRKRKEKKKEKGKGKVMKDDMEKDREDEEKEDDEDEYNVDENENEENGGQKSEEVEPFDRKDSLIPTISYKLRCTHTLCEVPEVAELLDQT
ncbi:hypothetical protein AcV7_005519 [Taiwanofungus camphoratus]|nr:hypothetical protein AcV7_005519 [Antrodia cinnamomea]